MSAGDGHGASVPSVPSVPSAPALAVSPLRVRFAVVDVVYYMCNFSNRAVTLGCLPVTAGGCDPPGDGHGAGIIMCVN